MADGGEVASSESLGKTTGSFVRNREKPLGSIRNTHARLHGFELVGLPPVISAGVSYCVSTVFNYVASMRYVFAHREGLSRTREFIIFVTLSIIGLGLNEAIMWLGGRLVGDEWYMLTKVIATALVMFWNFFSRKRWLEAG